MSAHTTTNATIGNELVVENAINNGVAIKNKQNKTANTELAPENLARPRGTPYVAGMNRIKIGHSAIDSPTNA